MAWMSWMWDQHLLLMQQSICLPFSLVFYFLSKWGYLSVKSRYLYASIGGCVLAILTLGMYSVLLFTSALMFLLLLSSVDHSCIHIWAFGIQMLWQTVWHLHLQYREYYLQDQAPFRLFLAVSALMLLTQRITSVSMDLQDQRLMLPSKPLSHRKTCVTFLPLISYILNFTTLLGGPLCSYSRFVSFMEEIHVNPPPNPLPVVSQKMMEVLLLECVKYCLVYLLKRNTYDPSNSAFFCAIPWVWSLAMVLRLQYYSHWRISECLNNAAGLGFWGNLPADFPEWNGLSDGSFWTVEASGRVSEFARRWNATTASWLRRLVYLRCKHFPLFTTFGFSLWWHGVHTGQFVGFLTWAATVQADKRIHRYWYPKLSSPQRKRLYVCLSWINTQMIITCVVIAVELRRISALKILAETYIVLFPLFNIIVFTVMKISNRTGGG